MLANWFSTTYICGADRGRERQGFAFAVLFFVMKWPFGISNDDRVSGGSPTKLQPSQQQKVALIFSTRAIRIDSRAHSN